MEMMQNCGRERGRPKKNRKKHLSIHMKESGVLGFWGNASRTNTRLQLMKALGTFLCWTQLELGDKYIQVLNCYLQPGE